MNEKNYFKNKNNNEIAIIVDEYLLEEYNNNEEWERIDNYEELSNM